MEGHTTVFTSDVPTPLNNTYSSVPFAQQQQHNFSFVYGDAFESQHGGEGGGTTALLSDQQAEILNVTIVFVMAVFAVIGVITNIINIRVFLEQGVRNDSTNIGLLCLSVADLFSCATLVPYPVCWVMKFVESLAHAPHYTCLGAASVLAFIHIPFQQIGAWTTVYISLVRSLCVLFPLKVKLMFTTKTTIVYIAFVSVFFVLFQIAYCSFISLVWVFEPAFNASFMTFRDSDTSRTVLYYKQLITNQILSVAAVIIVSVNTALMAIKLIQVKNWRQQHSNSNSNHESSSEHRETFSSSSSKLKHHQQRDDGNNRDSSFSASDSNTKPPSGNTNTNTSSLPPSKEIELINLVNTVTSIFLVCVLMGFIPSIALMIIPGVSFQGVNRNLFYVVFFTRFFFDAANSSVNFFFYLRVSSRYKQAFVKSFTACRAPTP